jgi:CRISPR-associated protein Cmr4
VLEEYSYTAEVSEQAKALAKQIAEWLGKPKDEYLTNNLIVLPNDEFTDFVQNATEIITRIKIDGETGTVATGALFTEELLPTETVLYSLVMASSIFLGEEDRKTSATVIAANDNEAEYLMGVIESKIPRYTQIGGDATIGKGLVEISIKGGK